MTEVPVVRLARPLPLRDTDQTPVNGATRKLLDWAGRLWLKTRDEPKCSIAFQTPSAGAAVDNTTGPGTLQVPTMSDAEPDRAMTLAYFTDATRHGTVRYNRLPGSIGILESRNGSMPIGIASAIGQTKGRTGGLVFARARCRRLWPMGHR
jgi:hypothetical protein